MRAAYAEQGQIVVKEVPEPVAGPGQLLVAVRAAGLNAADKLIVSGSHLSGASTRRPEASTPPTLPLGMEAAGVVAAVGEGAAGFDVGDRVMGVCGGAFAPYAVMSAWLAMRIPEPLTFAEAAAVPVVFTTAHDALRTAGHLQPGGNVLVTAAPSGVGFAALQLAREFGAGVVGASSRSRAKLDALERAGVSFDAGLVAGDPAFVDTGLAATEQHGFDVIIDNVGAPALENNVAVAALGARIVSVGRTGGRHGSIDLDELARKRVSLVGVTFRTRSPQQLAEVYRRAAADVLPALGDGRLRVILDRAFAFDEVIAAQEWMQTGRQIGKVVLTDEAT